LVSVDSEDSELSELLSGAAWFCAAACFNPGQLPMAFPVRLHITAPQPLVIQSRSRARFMVLDRLDRPTLEMSQPFGDEVQVHRETGALACTRA
jgi:hypothetical protein